MKRKSGSQRQFPDREVVETLRRQYLAGTRVVLISMDDPYTKLRPGDKGFVRSVDDTGTLGQRFRPLGGLRRGPAAHHSACSAALPSLPRRSVSLGY